MYCYPSLLPSSPVLSAVDNLSLALSRTPGLDVPRFLGKRDEWETFWVQHYRFLLSKGYQLRPRYDPEWVPSWITSSEPQKYLWHEDAQTLIANNNVNDATRLSDGSKVVLKHIKLFSTEAKLNFYFSEKQSQPQNHCVPILQFLPLPGTSRTEPECWMVMPQLLPFHTLPFCFVGEFAEAMRQFIEGLEFMHKHGVAHRDACHFNLMMDGSKVVPKGFHFLRPYSHTGDDRDTVVKWHSRWSVRPNRYFFIDFGLSQMYKNTEPLETQLGPIGQDRTVPEFMLPLSPFPYNPFKVDIYQLGNALIRVAEQYNGLEVFLPLLRPMTNQDPNDRPPLSDVLKQLDNIDTAILEHPVQLISPQGFEAFRVD